ncbi:MAG: hypothetical protein J5642_03590 [Bacteroidales bacterium]|nr:hypothetical protein [Bacteroidales bacterium]
MKKLIPFVLTVIASLFFTSCLKEEGEGGTAVVEGKVMAVIHDKDNYNLTTDTLAAAKTDVFIIYGDDVIYGDDMETGPDGSYRFKYLKSGTYTIYAYSTLPSGQRMAVSETVTVKCGKTVTVPTIYIHEGKAYGTSIVRGQVWATYIHNGSNRGEGWAYEHRVYIRRVGEPYHFDDVRVGMDGYYYFQQLAPGSYEIYTVTENSNEVPSYISQFIDVDEAGQVYTLDTFQVTINV